MGPKWHRRKRKATTDADIEQARRSLELARSQHDEQASKRQQEKERLIDPMQRLAEENHLAAWVWDIVAGSRGG